MNSIRARLYAVVALLIVSMIAIGAIGLINIKNNVASLDRVYSDRVVPLRDLKEVVDAYAVNIVDTTHKVRNGQFSPSEGLQKVRAAEATIRSKWEAYLQTRLVPEEQRLVDQAKPLMKVGDRATETLASLLEAGDMAGIAQFSIDELYPAIDPISDVFARLINVQLEVAEQEYVTAHESYQSTLVAKILGIVLASIVALAFAAHTIQGKVLRPLATAQALASRIASGDLTTTVDRAGKDEIGTMLISMADMQDKLKDVLRTIQHDAESLLHTSATLNSSTDNISEASRQQSDAASAMASAVEQLTVSVQQVAENAETARTQSEHAGGLSERGGETIARVVNDNQRIVDSTRNSAESVETLGKLSTEIRSIVGVIGEVADQTNLLALNAAIEAARAGEQGRGFAVVADEVRKLAERTSESTREITSIVERISNGTTHAVQTMHSQLELVDSCATLSAQAGESIAEIRAGSDEVVSAIKDISNALSDQSSASADIARNVEEIAQMSERNHATVDDTAAEARRLREMSESLQESVSRFKV